MFDDAWAIAQTNRPLANDREVGYAYVASLEADVVFHPERWKNWDNYLAVYHAHALAKDTPILDAGACRDPKSPSAFLPTLSSYGFTRLFGCNLDEPASGAHEHGISYDRRDIVRTGYPDEFFGFVACLSTIEHGVNEFDFLDEMYRILMPGGALFVSFDYWRTAIDTGNRHAFGVPVRIFDGVDVLTMTRYARDIDFTHDEIHLQCDEPLVKWLGLEYTFMNLLLRKPPIKTTGC